MAGITDSGFVRKTLTEILDSLTQGAKNEFGPTFNTKDDSVYQQIAGTFGLELDEVWQALEGAYSAYTLSGAEGVFLDDLFARHNIIRLAATKGTGIVYIEMDETTTLPLVYPITTALISSNDTSYVLSSATTVDTDKTSAYKILNDDIIVGTNYIITVEDSLGVNQSTAFNVVDEAAKATLITTIDSHITTHNATIAAKTQDFPSAGEIFIGFDSNKSLDPLTTEVDFFLTPAIGNRFTSAPAIAVDAGFFPLSSGGITDLSPKPTGFVSVTNVSSFGSGTGVESDAEFRSRFNKLIDASATGCDRESIIAAILNVSGVTNAQIFENPTDTPTAEAAAFSYNTVVFGGLAADIGQALFDNGPVNVSTDGSTTVPIVASSGDTFNIKFTIASEAPLNVRVTYSSSLGVDISTEEEQKIIDSINAIEVNFDIGDTVFNLQLNGAVVNALEYGLLTDLTVETKRTSEPVGSFTTANFVPLFSEIPTIADLDISFVRV